MNIITPFLNMNLLGIDLVIISENISVVANDF